MRKHIPTKFDNNYRFMLQDFGSYENWDDVWQTLAEVCAIVEALVADDDDDEDCTKRNAIHQFEFLATAAVMKERSRNIH